MRTPDVKDAIAKRYSHLREEMRGYKVMHMENKPQALDLGDEATLPLGPDVGIYSNKKIATLLRRKMIWSLEEIESSQIQPASLDLRLGKEAYRVRASFLPGSATVKEKLSRFQLHKIDLEEGAVLERGCVYVIPLLEAVDLPESVSAYSNPKSSTGRLDVFTRLITDRSNMFDRVEARYEGPLYVEVSPRTFSVKVRKGSRLNQLRFRYRSSSQSKHQDFCIPDKKLRKIHEKHSLVEGHATIRNGLHLGVDLTAKSESDLIGYRAQRYTDIIDIDEPGKCRIEDYWEKIYANADNRLILDPNEFYILASKETVHIPSNLAAEMVAIDPMMGEFRVHYAGFFDPGFGYAKAGGSGSRAVLEVRSHEVPFILEDGQFIGRLIYEKLTEEPEMLYGQGIGSNYQKQGLKLSKHFLMPE